MEWSTPPKKDGIYGMREWLSTQLSSQSHKTQTFFTKLWFVLPALEPRVNGCKRDFGCWLLIGVPVSLVDSFSLADRNPSAFHSQMLCGCLFSALVLCAGDPPLGFRCHNSQGEPHHHHYHSWDILLEPQPPLMGLGPVFFCVSALFTSLDVASSVNP